MVRQCLYQIARSPIQRWVNIVTGFCLLSNGFITSSPSSYLLSNGRIISSPHSPLILSNCMICYYLHVLSLSPIIGKILFSSSYSVSFRTVVRCKTKINSKTVATIKKVLGVCGYFSLLFFFERGGKRIENGRNR